MRYISTRGGVDPISFSQAVMMGLATDGGLLLPETIPAVDAATLSRWANLSYPQLAVEVMSPFMAGDISKEDLAELVRRSCLYFTHEEITPTVKVGDHYILELFHGPTLAFKDVALQLLGNLFEYLLARSGGRLNILGATSGDTGSAAIYGVRGKERINIFILHPHQRVSPVQERQMTSVLDDNVHNIAVRGSFDDGQRIVKELFNQLDFKERYSLGAVNSINWARILAQVVYYFYAWGRVSGGKVDQQVVFSVPTGNFGDIFAGYVAMRMGLPVSRLILATNRNDILHRFMQQGVYATGEVHPTLSPSMDIQVSSNFERYLYYLLGENPGRVKGLMDQLSSEGRFAVREEERQQAIQLFTSCAVNELETVEQIRHTWKQHHYLLDPHSAVGVSAAKNVPGAICLATAHPAKFADAVEKAIGQPPAMPVSLADILSLPTRCAVLDAETSQVKEHMIRILG
ncbi:MAG: threonine synthase [Magnetococcales bacterium]|nr:threonine synthase [Magnetococcales bacterium]NGZ25669.1 threonine synthase [Magnetococcales bacterium]